LCSLISIIRRSGFFRFSKISWGTLQQEYNTLQQEYNKRHAEASRSYNGVIMEKKWLLLIQRDVMESIM